MKLIDNSRRFIEYIENQTPLYSYWVVFCIVLFIFVGILPTSKRMYVEYQTLTEMKTVEIALQKKLEELKVAAKTMRDINPYIPYIIS